MRNSNFYAKGKWKGFVSGFCGLFFLIFVFTACDDSAFEGFADDNSREARIEEALIALDNADYSTALSILIALENEFPGNSQILRYKSNAYAGLAGLDTFNLLKTIDQLKDQDKEGSIDMVGRVLGDSDGILSSAEIADKLSKFDNAISALEEINNPTDDEIVQLGILSMNHAALTLADIINDDTGNDSIELTEDGISELYKGETPDLTDEATEARLTAISKDIARVGESVETIADISGTGDNDLSTGFDEFRNDINNNVQNDGITQQELETYIGNL